MKIIITLLLTFVSINIIGQSSARESWSFGIGVHNFYTHGDLRSIESGLSDTENNLINLGTYIYVDKMISPTFGFEAKFSYSKMSGVGQELSNSYTVAGTPLSQLRFEGNAYGGELNTIINLSSFSRNPYRSEERKWGFFGTLGVGLHRYDSKLYEINTSNLLVDYGDSPSENGSTSSMYFTSGIGLKYKLTPQIDIELRQNFNLNEEDHLDAAVSSKQALEFFFKTNIGIVFKLNDKNHDNFIWHDNLGSGNFITRNEHKKAPIKAAIKTPKKTVKKSINNTLKDNDISKDKDSDNDGLRDFEDECPLTFAKTKNGCPKISVDTDNDGVLDVDDKCPTIFSTNSDGCPTAIDSDGDGIPDDKDKCPTVFSTNRDGCPKIADSDGDGIADDIDKCPKIFAQNSDGCPRKIKFDTDKDGIPNAKDKCPLTFAKTKNGCPKKIDSDADGIYDFLDKCPNIFAKTRSGCPKKEKIKSPIVVPSKPKTVAKKVTSPIVVPSKPKTATEKVITDLNKNNVSHANKVMDSSLNVNDVTASPVFPGCEKKADEFDKKNCMITEISKFIIKNYNSRRAKKINSKVRVLFIIDKSGKTKVVNVLGNDILPNAKQELKRVIESVPKMRPGLLNSVPVPVKYSLRFDLRE